MICELIVFWGWRMMPPSREKQLLAMLLLDYRKTLESEKLIPWKKHAYFKKSGGFSVTSALSAVAMFPVTSMANTIVMIAGQKIKVLWI